MKRFIKVVKKNPKFGLVNWYLLNIVELLDLLVHYKKNCFIRHNFSKKALKLIGKYCGI